MKNSTVLLVFGILGLGGVGTYLYLKNKKNSVVSSLPTSTTTTTTTPTSGTSSVADDTLGLSPKPTIDTVVSAFAETQTENYKKAKVISKNIETAENILRGLQNEYNNARNVSGGFLTPSYSPKATIQLKINAVKNEMSKLTSQANALGYKILPYGEIEKM